MDLLLAFQSARQFAETGIIDLSTSLRYYNLARGWSFPHASNGGGLQVTAAVDRECSLRYSVVRPAERWLRFKIGLQGRFGNLDKQQIEVYAGNPRRLLASFEKINNGWMEKQFGIPADLQVAGNNELFFKFAEFVENPSYLAEPEEHEKTPYPGVAAYFSDFRIHLGNKKSPNPEWIRNESNVFHLDRNGSQLRQLANSELSYAYEIEAGASLALSGTVASPGKRRHELTVSIVSRTEADPVWRKLWSRGFKFSRDSAAQDFSAEISIEGRLAEFRFSVIDSAPFSRAAVTWKRLHLSRPKQDAETSAGKTNPPVRMPAGVRHVVMIVLDAARADYFGCYGDTRGMTPRLDEFAKSSVIFRDAVAPAPYTLATTWSLLSGRMYRSKRILGDTRTPAESESLPSLLNRAGYHTVAFSGNVLANDKWGPIRDFDYYFSLRSETDIGKMNSRMDMEVLDRGIREAAGSGKPIFIYIHLLPPHWPYYPPEPFATRFTQGHQALNLKTLLYRIDAQLASGIAPDEIPEVVRLRKCYMNNLLYADHLADQILELLRSHGLFDESMIILTADHGEAFGEHGRMEHVTTVYEEMIRVPLIVRLPGIEPREIERPAGLIDIYPTIVELLNLEPALGALPGRSIAPLLVGRDRGGGAYYFSRAGVNRMIFSLRGKRYKYIYNNFSEELYDLETDPGETRNIISRLPVLAAYLRQRGMGIVHSKAGSRLEESREIQFDPEERRELRNLGYIQ